MELVVITLLWLGLVANDDHNEPPPAQVQVREPIYEEGLCFYGKAMGRCKKIVGYTEITEQD